MAGAVLALALSASPAFAQTPDAHADSTTLQATYTDVARNGMQEDVTGDWTDSKETNTVQESEMTRQMIQAEKHATLQKTTNTVALSQS